MLLVWFLLATVHQLLATEVSSIGKEVLYDGYKVIRVHPQTLSQLYQLQKLSQVDDKGQKINFWSEPNRINSTTDVMVAPDVADELKTFFDRQNIKSETLINDVGR